MGPLLGLHCNAPRDPLLSSVLGFLCWAVISFRSLAAGKAPESVSAGVPTVNTFSPHQPHPRALPESQGDARGRHGDQNAETSPPQAEHEQLLEDRGEEKRRAHYVRCCCSRQSQDPCYSQSVNVTLPPPMLVRATWPHVSALPHTWAQREGVCGVSRNSPGQGKRRPLQTFYPFFSVGNQ